MKSFILLSAILGLCLGFQNITNGQVMKVTLLHNGISTFHADLTAAQTAAVNGDTIYLPGGPIGGASITKKLTIIGAGYHPDSTQATFITSLTSDIYLNNAGASGGTLMGISGRIQFSTTVTISSFTFKRCYISLYVATNLNYPGTNAQNFLFSECILTSIDSYVTFGSVVFEKNIFFPNVYYNKSATFSNNIFYDDGTLQTYYNSFFNNNIFIITNTSTSLANVSYCMFNNNLFCTTGATLTISNWGNANYFNNNLTNQLAMNTFVNATTTTFNYSNNYHLLPTSPGHLFGTDQTDVGIYGTSLPWKDGGLPFNPHISSKTIGTQLSPTGNLSIDIKVTAQDR